jgi:hypothetical protein
MRRSSIPFATNDQGQLCVQVPRDTYAALAVVLAVAVAFMFTRWGDAVAAELQAPGWAWWGAKGVFLAFAAAFGAQALWGHALVFDTQCAAITRGTRVLAPFAEVSHVELLERRGQKPYRYWAVRVHLINGRRVFLGRESDKTEADLAAARVASVLGKPVKHLVR